MVSDGKRRPRRRGGTVTLKDVADHAGVAMMTVSRAINKPDAVSDSLRAKINTAIDELGYVQNRFAGSLASVRTRLVTVVVPELSSRVFAEIVRGAGNILNPRGYQILVSNTSYSLQDEEEACRRVLGWRPEGIIVSGIDHSDTTRKLLGDAGVPVVEALEIGDNQIDINIGLSHFNAGTTVANHLMEKGYRKIGFIGAQMDMDFRAQRRYSGFVQALTENGIKLAYEATFVEPSSFELGAQAIAAFEDCGKQADAIFCVNDELAVGGIFECQRRGLKIPEDIAIIGFNDLDISSQIVPGLTTIRSPRERMGELAATTILDRINGTADDPHLQVDVGFELIVRGST